MKKLLPLLFLLVVVAGIILFFRANAPSGRPSTVWEQTTDIKVEASTLYEEFMNDETGANEKYLNKITEVSGEVSTIRTGEGSISVVLRTKDPNFGVRCRIDPKPGQAEPHYEVGQNVRFKCICSGYVQDVEMVQCQER